MRTWDVFSSAVSSALYQQTMLLPVGGLVIVLIIGCAVGCLGLRAYRTRHVQRGPVNFPGAVVQLEKNGFEWSFALISEGADQIGTGWEAITSVNEKIPLDRVFEDLETGVLTDVLDNAVKFNLPVNFECRLKTDTFEAHWVALILSLDAKSDKPLMNGMVISIMDRRILDEELFEEKQFAEQVLEDSGVVFSVRNRDMKLIRANKAFVEIGGYTPEELYFADGDRFLAGESYDHLITQFSRVLNGDYPLISEDTWYCKDDSKRLLRWTHTGIMNSEQQVNHIISVGVDITDLRVLEDRLKEKADQFEEINDRLEVEMNQVQLLADHRMAVIELFDTFRNSLTIEDLLGILKNNLPQFVKYRDLMVALRISRSNPAYFIRDLVNETAEDDIMQMLQDGKGIIGYVIQSREMYLSNDVRQDSFFVPHNPNVRSYLAIPILYKDFLWGVIGLDHFKVGHFTDQDVEILSIVGTLIAMQMEEMSAKLALYQESDRLRMLHELVQQMAQARNNEDILNKICSSGLFAAVHIYKAGPDGRLNTCPCALCEGGFPLPEAVDEMQGVPHASWESHELSYRYNSAFSICYNSQFLGVIRVCSDLPFSEQEIELGSILAEQTGVFWELNNLIAQREREAMIDPLTSVWNRRYMLARLEQEDERIFRYGGNACVAILDMGDFKLINDQYGHVKGDEVLIAAARQIDRSIRKTDFVGRYGGDEFIVFLPNTNLRDAETLLEKINDGISCLFIDGIHRQIEIDSGAAVVPGDDSSLMGAVRTADERMYLNKRERKRRTLLRA